MKREYRTSVDLLFVVLPVIFLALESIVYLICRQMVNPIILTVGCGILLCIIVFLMSIATTKYTISTQNIIIRNLLFKKNVDLNEIEEVQLNCNGISWCAASTKQVVLILKNNEMIRISPTNREDFIKSLQIFRDYILA